MNTVQLAPFKHGSSVYIKMTTMSECTGTYKGLLEEDRSIWLNDVKWYSEPSKNSPTNYEALILPLEQIAHIQGIENEKSDDTIAASVVRFPDAQTSKRTSSNNFALNCFAGRNIHFKGKITRTKSAQMQEFCNQLFSNCNFAHLLQTQARKNEPKFCINLPSYVASFFRQPTWHFDEMQQPAAENQDLAIMKSDDACTTIDISFLNEADNSHANAAKVIDDTEQQKSNFVDTSNCADRDLCSMLSDLSLDNKTEAAFEAVEVDVSNLQTNNSFAQIKIGNLCFKASTYQKDSSAQMSSSENQATSDLLMEI